MKVILFDIDGTLVRTGGAGKAAIEAGLAEEFGVELRAREIPYSGRTDRAIGHDLLVAHDIDPTQANITRLIDAYIARLPHTLARNGGHICPGISVLVQALHRRTDITLGLLTGNVRRGARHKLGHHGLWDYFAFGGFGDHHPNRDDVAREAVASAHAHLGKTVPPADIWVIGDTPLDISCARAIGARVLAVATGYHPFEELAELGPDLVMADLSEPGVFWERLGD